MNCRHAGPRPPKITRYFPFPFVSQCKALSHQTPRMSPIPNLLYHHPSLTPHPANTSSSLLTIRFPSPIRITSLRITPEGVTGLTGPGYVWSNATPLTESTTYPAEWVGKVYLNVSPGTPVNALASTEIRVWAAGFALDYPIEMPEGVRSSLPRLTHSPESRLIQDGR